jgi:hypothetical protein
MHYFREHIENIVELSQIRYMGIKLNAKVLVMNPDELGDLYDCVIEYQGYLMDLPKREITRNRIRAEITKRGLADFMKRHGLTLPPKKYRGEDESDSSYSY